MGNYENEVYYTREEFMDELAKQLGQAYGLNDIREARRCVMWHLAKRWLFFILLKETLFISIVLYLKVWLSCNPNTLYNYKTVIPLSNGVAVFCAYLCIITCEHYKMNNNIKIKIIWKIQFYKVWDWDKRCQKALENGWKTRWASVSTVPRVSCKFLHKVQQVQKVQSQFLPLMPLLPVQIL